VLGHFLLDAMGPLLPVSGLLLALAVFRWFRGSRSPGHELRLFRDGSGVLMEFDGSRTTSHPLVAGQVHARLATSIETQDEKTYTVDYLALDHATSTHSLMAAFSHAERAWVVDEIESWLGR
jgi:hypothetical protein